MDWEDTLENGMGTHSSIHAWKIPWTEEPAGLQSMGTQKLDMTSYVARTHPPVDNSPVALLLFAFYFIDFNLFYFLLFIQLKINK